MRIAITIEENGFLMWTSLCRTEKSLVSELERNKKDRMSFVTYNMGGEIKSQPVHSIFFCTDENYVTNIWDAVNGYRNNKQFTLPEIIIPNIDFISDCGTK